MHEAGKRSIETALARTTLVIVAVYAPLETWVSWGDGLLSPYYLVDVVAMVLLFWGALYSLSRRPQPASGVLCAAYAWTSANGWRATADRWRVLEAGGALAHGSAEMWIVSITTALSIVVFAGLLFLLASSPRPGSR
jgi:hypothetical protein